MLSVGGTPAEILQHSELMDYFLPILRTDLHLYDHFRCPEPVLPLPIIAFSGLRDQIATPGIMAGWSRHTNATFRQILLPADHFLIRSHATEVFANIRRYALNLGAAHRMGSVSEQGS